MSSPVKLMSTLYIRWGLDDEDADSMEGQINDMCIHKTIESIGRRLIFLFSPGSPLRPKE